MNISLDFSEIAQEFNLIASQADLLAKAAVDAVSQEVYRQWQLAARQGLHSTRTRYIQALQMVEEGPLRNAIFLNPADKFVQGLEDGVGAYDMKEGFKKSAKVKFNAKGGWYLTVPFRIGTPGAVGEMFSGVMPVDIYQMARKLIASTTQPDGTKTRGTRLTVPVGNDAAVPRTRPELINPQTGQKFAAYTHKTGLFDGLQRQEKTYGKTTQSTYNTFRRVGANSDPNSWINKGIQAHNFADKALSNTNIEVIQENAVDAVLQQMGF